MISSIEKDAENIKIVVNVGAHDKVVFVMPCTCTDVQSLSVRTVVEHMINKNSIIIGNNMMKIIYILCVLSGFLSADIRIAVAANVSYVIDPLIEAFHTQHPDIKVQTMLGSSGKLSAQIMHGAPYDVFMSANMKYPQALYIKKLATAKPVVYAQGALALFSQKPRDFSNNIAVLENPDIAKIAIGNPKTAPYGVAAVEALKNANLYTKLKEKFVYGESISQTVMYAKTAADMGIIAMSALYAPQMKMYEKEKNWVEVESGLYTSIDQGMVLLKDAENNAEAKAFYDFMLSTKARNILKSFGYKIP